MIKVLLVCVSMIIVFTAQAKKIVVANSSELKMANSTAQPGDIIEMKEGEWSNITITLTCNGTKAKPITVKAATNGKVRITGFSKMNIGGNYLVINGLYFVNGYAGTDEVISFKANQKVANHCRLTNTIIDDFNNIKRLDENYWIALYGKNNRIDHCEFYNKKNMGVLLAVILDDEQSRNNNHSIDNNRFGIRIPLASNTGEIIRVGVSQHCEFTSSTKIVNNFFDKCSGETEIVSIKSCGNTVANNLFNECQGSVVLRHGNDNVVANNVFWGNNKPGTGGVRVINKGQWVVNNYFYKCRGEGFRSPLAIMNGVPNSPAHRYVQVTDAVIANNSFVGSSPIGLCIGSDAERTMTPDNVLFLNNLFYNKTDSIIYTQYDDFSGIKFWANYVSNSLQQSLPRGFEKNFISEQKLDIYGFAVVNTKTITIIPDTLQTKSLAKLGQKMATSAGFKNLTLLKTVLYSTKINAKSNWKKPAEAVKENIIVNCQNDTDVVNQLTLHKNNLLTINLTGTSYVFAKPIIIDGVVEFKSNGATIEFASNLDADYFILLKAGSNVTFTNINANLKNTSATNFIMSDSSGHTNHYDVVINNCTFSNYNGTFFKAAKTSVANRITINNSTFNNNNSLFDLSSETDKKGYYNVEQLHITNCSFTNNYGQVLNLARTGTDESTMGPLLQFTNNNITNCNNDIALFYLQGVQLTTIANNKFNNCNTNKTLLHYIDVVSAKHILQNNSLVNCGAILENKYVVK
jgi:poly(beta-D-mannuronate) lyase